MKRTRFEKQTLPDLLEILGNGTVAEKQGDLISNDTLRQVEQSFHKNFFIFYRQHGLKISG